MTTTDFPIRTNDNPFLALAGGPRGEARGNAYPARAAQPVKETSAFRKLHALLRGRYALTAVLCTIGALGGAALGYKSQRPVYTSSGQVELKLIVPSLWREDRIMLMASQFMTNQVNVVQNQRVIGAAMTNHDWQATGRGNTPDAQAEFMKNLDVDIIPGSTYMRVAFTDPEPAVARAAVASVLASYKDIYSEVNTTETRRKIQLLEQARTLKTNTIAEKREQILALSQEFGTSDLTTLHNAKVQALVNLESDLAGARSNLEGVESAVKRGGGASTPSAPAAKGAQAAAIPIEEIAIVDPTVRELSKQIRDADFKLQRLGSTVSPNHKVYIEAQRDMQLLRTQLDEAVATFRARYVAIRTDPATGNPMPVSLETLQQLKDRVAFLQSRYDAQKELTTRIGKTKLSIQALENDIDRLRGELDSIARNMESLTAETVMGGDINIISMGDMPVTPSKDKRKQMAALGFAGGGLLPLGILLLIGLLDARYRYSDDHSDNLPHVPLLGILPHLPNLSTDPQQATVAAHCVHQIRTMLEIAADTQGRRVFAITSPSPTDGKTSLSLALGLSFAAAGTKTLLIDCDVIGGGLSARMNQTHPVGTLEAVASRQLAPYVRPTDIENLSILPVGTASGHHPTILSPTAMGRVVADARAKYDIVLIDTGPVLGSVEAGPVCASADAVVLVVSRGRHKAQVARALDHLVSIGARLAGVVFNRASTPDFERSTSRLTLRRDESPVQA